MHFNNPQAGRPGRRGPSEYPWITLVTLSIAGFLIFCVRGSDGGTMKKIRSNILGMAVSPYRAEDCHGEVQTFQCL